MHFVKKGMNLGMTTFILAILFCFIACLESTVYGIYEIKVNKNRTAGFLIILLSIIGFIFPITMYLRV